VLRDLDDTLWHQVPENFEHVGLTDTRFYDRYWFAIYAPDGSIGLNIGMGVFNNQNVVDGAATAIAGGTQYSFLASRALRPRFETAVGPLSVDPVEPLVALRLLLERGSQPMAFDLTWRATWQAREEKPAFSRNLGRISQKTCRFDQLGVVDGWVEVAGRRFEADEWFGGRDHSWGVRDGVAGQKWPDMGGVRPYGYAFWFIFTTPTRSGNISFSWSDGQHQNLTGSIEHRSGTDEVHDSIVDVSQVEVDLYPGTRRFRSAEVHVVLESGEEVVLRAKELVRAFAMTGVGYGGFRDRQGHGVWRGEYYEEWNEWDVTHPEDVILENGEIEHPWHRDAGVTVRIDDEEGLGHLMLMVVGDETGSP
jgi:hypothetical protein